MPNLNKCLLIGNLTRDPEINYLQSGTPVTNFSIAINRVTKTDNGESAKKSHTSISCCGATWLKTPPNTSTKANPS
jgi:single-strand DNA-binding protein